MKFFAWFLFLSGGLATGFAAEFSVRSWDVDEGLPESGITDVIQSPDGYLWVSTLNSGLSRFDGVRFVNFEPPASSQLASHGFRRLFADADGTLWLNGYGNYMASLCAGKFQWEFTGPTVINWLVWAGGGRAVFATKEGQLLERTPGAGTNNSWKIIPAPDAGGNTRFFADAQTNFWYRSTNGDLCRITGEKAATFSPDGADPQVNALAGDASNSIAVIAAQKLLVWDGTRFQDITPTNGGLEISARALVSDGQGGWWVDANNRLRRCQNRNWIAESEDWQRQKRNWSRVKWEQADALGGLWMAYADGGLIHVSAAGRLAAVTTKEGLPSNRVRIMTQDRDGNVWASFERGGLVCIRSRLFQAVGNREGLSDIVTTSVCEDGSGAIWIGTLGGTVSRWSHGVCTNFTLPQEGTHCEMTTVFPDADGRVWIGTHGNGLLVYEAGQFRHVLAFNQTGANIRGLFASRDGRVWIASQDGLFRLFNGELRQLQTPKSEADYPTALAEGAGGKIWVAMNSGALVSCIGDQVTTFDPADPAMRSRFSAVFEDAHGTVWIGTLGAGLLRFQEGKFSAITTRDGLPTDNITQVLDDEAGNLWLGSPVGVISVRKDSLAAQLHGTNQNLVCHAYGRNEGLPTVGCAIASQPTAWRGRDGRLWFATSKGIASVLSPDSSPPQHPPLVVIEDMHVDGEPGKPVVRGQNEAAAAPWYLTSDNRPGAPVKLTPGRHEVNFRFTGLNFSDPERIRFKYMLEGLETAWAESTERTVSYRNVPPGEYHFRVQAQNSDGQTSAAEAVLDIIIPPHIWETRWFRFTVLGMILISVAGTVFWVLQVRHKRELRALEHRHALERERTRIAQDIHDDLGASLTRITMLSQSAMNRIEPVKTPGTELSRIYQTARSMTNAMDEIVWAINPSHDTLESLAAYFAEFVQDFLSPTGLKFNLDMPLGLPQWNISSEVRHNLFLAFKEALNNVVKHSKATEVVITLEVRRGGFVLSVADNGCGFDAMEPAGSKLEPVRRVRGNGLNNMRRRLEELGGRCTVTSRPGGGTRVAFEVELQR
ncbi:MAG TPA: two-component regulator propeller domain-containing protein [Candidatus Acidoferrales bacterium]|nr:two-component regulator propeller domain-containing protein [Candidatus Acidoferrales bacterium]